MGLPEEDMGPAWLRDWGRKTGFTDLDTFSGYVDSNALSVDIKTLVAFADALQTEHEEDYRPHVRQVFEDMSAHPEDPDGRFIELTETMTHHRDMLVQTSTALANHDTAIIAFVGAARAISKEYGATDALTAARVSDVEANLNSPPTTGGNNGQGTTTTTPAVVVTPEQAAEQTETQTTTKDQPSAGNGSPPSSSVNGRDA